MPYECPPSTEESHHQDVIKLMNKKPLDPVKIQPDLDSYAY